MEFAFESRREKKEPERSKQEAKTTNRENDNNSFWKT
ncbi:hypothetical protein HRbin35_00007 [bacterium HR35]|nr:hypothetical protein HRbin35_00007 [bacterium HR35]